MRLDTKLNGCYLARKADPSSYLLTAAMNAVFYEANVYIAGSEAFMWLST